MARLRPGIWLLDKIMKASFPFPAAVEDGYDALLWAAARAKEFGGDPTRLAVMGESAGSNLAAVVAIMARPAMSAVTESQRLALRSPTAP